MKRLLLPILILWCSSLHGAVAYEAAAHGQAYGTSLTYSITLGAASSTRAVMIGVFRSDVVGITVKVGGESATQITGTSCTGWYNLSMYGLTTALTGAQDVVIAGTNSAGAVSGAISATGVNQATPFNNGTCADSNYSTPQSLAITSTSGDLTATFVVNAGVASSTDQTLKYTELDYGTIYGYGDVGPGTGMTTHTWTMTGNGGQNPITGANFNQATAATVRKRVIVIQ